MAEEAPDEGDAAGKPVSVGVGDAAGGLAVVDTAARVGLGEVAVSGGGTDDSDGTITTTSREGEASGDDDARSGLAEASLSAGELGEADAGMAVTTGVGETATATLGDPARLGLAAALAGALELDDPGVGARVVDEMATGDREGSAEKAACPADGVGEDAVAAPDEGEAAVDGSVAVEGRGATLVTVASCLGAHLASLGCVECESATISSQE